MPRHKNQHLGSEDSGKSRSATRTFSMQVTFAEYMALQREAARRKVAMSRMVKDHLAGWLAGLVKKWG